MSHETLDTDPNSINPNSINPKPIDPKYIEAKRRVQEEKGFYIHLLIYCVVIVGLFALNAATRSPWWVQWPFLGWGVGIIGHAVAVFAPRHLFHSDWEQRRINKRMSKL
jgi:hypothetical protein